MAQELPKPEKPDQDFCYTTEMNQWMREQNPELGSAADFEKVLQEKIRQHKENLKLKRTQAQIYTLPVVFHIIHNGEPVGTGANLSAKRINQELKMVNDNLRKRKGTHGYSTNPVSADAEIELAPALRDPQGLPLPEPGINRYSFKVYRPGMTVLEVLKNIESVLKPATAWNPHKYLNIWILDYKDAPFSASYASAPNAFNYPYSILGLPAVDGIVLDNLAITDNKLGTTTTHELGHWLGLLHTWGASNGAISDCTGDDFCADTPTHREPTWGCPKKVNTCPQPGTDPIDNYMNYTDASCRNTLTNDQKLRMHTVLLNLVQRKTLLRSTVHLPDEGQPTAYFEANRTAACASSTVVTLTDRSTNKPTSWQWTFYDYWSGRNVGTFTQQNLSVTLARGTHSVQLVARNSKGSDTLFIPGYLVGTANATLPLPYKDDLESNQRLSNWLSYNKDQDGFWWQFLSRFDDSTYVIGSEGKVTTALGWNRSSNLIKFSWGEVREDWLFSPIVNLALYPNAEFSFDLAYRPIYGSGDLQRDDRLLSAIFTSLDTLSLQYSTDCGLTYTTLWKKGASDLATVAPEKQGQYIFYPTAASQWRREKVSLSSLNGQSNVTFALVIKGGLSSRHLYIDNLEIKVPPVTKAPVAGFTVTQAAVCAGSPIQFMDASKNAPTTWKWSFPGGTPSTSTAQHPFVTYRTPGTYSVTLTATNSLGNHTVSKRRFIVVNALDLKAVAAKTTVCLGDTIFLSAQGGSPDATNYWEASDGKKLLRNGFAKNPHFIPNKAGTYTFRLFGETKAGCPVRSSVKVKVKAVPPKPKITPGSSTGSVIARLTSSSSSGNQWFRNGKLLPGATGSTYNVTMTGSYSVQVTTGGCSSPVSEGVTIGVTAVNRFPIPDEFVQLFPNPATQEVVIQVAPPASKSDLYASNFYYSIYNSLGIKLIEGALNKGANNWERKISIAHLPAGHYVVLIRNRQSHFSRSFIKL